MRSIIDLSWLAATAVVLWSLVMLCSPVPFWLRGCLAAPLRAAMCRFSGVFLLRAPDWPRPVVMKSDRGTTDETSTREAGQIGLRISAPPNGKEAGTRGARPGQLPPLREVRDSECGGERVRAVMGAAPLRARTSGRARRRSVSMPAAP